MLRQLPLKGYLNETSTRLFARLDGAVVRSAFGVAIATLLFFCAAPVVNAQGWLADRSRAEGAGIRLGDFELHPGIGVELGYDSNLYYTQDGSTTAPYVSTALLRVSPHFFISTRGAQRNTEGEGSAPDEFPEIQFRAGVNAAYYEFFADSSRRNVEIGGNFRLTLLQGRPFSVAFYDTFSRQIRPFTENFRSEVTPARIRNTVGTDLIAQTVGGVLQFRLNYEFGISYFEATAFNYGNLMDHSLTLSETWRFLPSTALVHDTTVFYNDYFSYNPVDSPTALSDGLRLRSRLGITGSISEQISLSIMGGYGAGFFGSAAPGVYLQDYESFVALVEGRWSISESIRLTAGYERDYFPSYIGNFTSRDRGYVQFQLLLGGSFLAAVDAEVAYLDYGVIVAPDLITPIGDRPSREDIRVGAGLFLEYRFTDWLAVNGTARYTGNFTDYQFQLGGGGSPLFIDPAAYNKFEAYLGARVFY